MESQVNQKALDKFSYGIYVVTSRDGERLNGLVVNTVVQVALNPTLVSVTINKNSLTNEFVRKSGVLAISVLERDTPLEFIGRFGFRSGRDFNKFEGLSYETGITGAPLITDYTVSLVEGKVREIVDCVTHNLFVVEVVAARVIKDAEPLTYTYYHQVKKGKTGKGAPSYREEKKDKVAIKPEERGNNMTRYVCTVCGYVYDPLEGDPEHDIPPRTSFEKLPDDWVCPVCGADKDQFEPEE